MNIYERQVYLSSKIEFRPMGVANPTDAEVIVEMRREIALLRTSSFETDQDNSDASTEIKRMEAEPLKSDECPICKYKFDDCQCRFGGKAHPNRWKRAKVVTDHLYLFSDAQIEHLKKVQEWWHTSYDDEEMENILKELEAERKEE